MFSESKTPVEVVIALDLPVDQVQAIYREFWELNGMHKLVEIHDQIKYSLHSYLELHKIVSAQRMGEQEIINVLKLANNNELPYLQEKVEYIGKSTQVRMESMVWIISPKVFGTIQTFQEDHHIKTEP